MAMDTRELILKKYVEQPSFKFLVDSNLTLLHILKQFESACFDTQG